MFAAGLGVSRVRFCWQAQHPVTPGVGVGESVCGGLARGCPGWGGVLGCEFCQLPCVPIRSRGKKGKRRAQLLSGCMSYRNFRRRLAGTKFLFNSS